MRGNKFLTPVVHARQLRTRFPVLVWECRLRRGSCSEFHDVALHRLLVHLCRRRNVKSKSNNLKVSQPCEPLRYPSPASPSWLSPSIASAGRFPANSSAFVRNTLETLAVSISTNWHSCFTCGVNISKNCPPWKSFANSAAIVVAFPSPHNYSSKPCTPRRATHANFEGAVFLTFLTLSHLRALSLRTRSDGAGHPWALTDSKQVAGHRTPQPFGAITARAAPKRRAAPAGAAAGMGRAPRRLVLLLFGQLLLLAEGAFPTFQCRNGAVVATGNATAGVVASGRTESSVAMACTWVVGVLSHDTQIQNITIDADPGYSTLAIFGTMFGAFSRDASPRKLEVAERPSAPHWELLKRPLGALISRSPAPQTGRLRIRAASC